MDACFGGWRAVQGLNPIESDGSTRASPRSTRPYTRSRHGCSHPCTWPDEAVRLPEPLEDVTFEVSAGEVFGFLRPNVRDSTLARDKKSLH
jgi:hypothetical protein